jgi:hypothetical protein
MAHGKKITLHLVDGTPKGIIKAKLGQWVGLVTTAPRIRLDDLAADDEVKLPGVYILSGVDPEDLSSRVYIGESENVFTRLKQHEHNDDKSFYDQVTVITSTDEHLTKGHIKYLESRLIQLAHDTKRASVDNGTRPDASPLPAADRDDMNAFLENLQILLPVLGLNFALPLPTPQKRNENPIQSGALVEESPVFYASTGEQGSAVRVTAKAQLIGSEFVVLKGSEALLRNDSMSYSSLKESLIRKGILIENNDRYVFVEDAPFSSVSAAGVVIRGKNTNGKTFWKLDDGRDYAAWLDERIKANEMR